MNEEYKAGMRRMLALALESIIDEPEFPGDMPPELWDMLNGNRDNTIRVMRSTVKLTKNGITDRLLVKAEDINAK